MFTDSFKEFLASGDCLQVYKGDRLVFASTQNGLVPLLEYIDQMDPHYQPSVIFDKIIGNAAALLCVKAGSEEVYSPLGSQLAARTLDKYGIEYHLTEIAPYIKHRLGTGMCPMDELSIEKGPEEFYQGVKGIVKGQLQSDE